MAKAKTPSFVLTLKLNTNERDEKELAERFFAAFLMKNKLVTHARSSMRGLRQDKEYRLLMEQRKPLVGKNDSVSKRKLREINEQLASVRRSHGLSEYQFHAWISLQQHRYCKHIDSMTAQKIASSVWSGVEAVLFRKGETLHYEKLCDLDSLEGKTNASGIRFVNGRVHWLGLCIQPQIRHGDRYAAEALSHRVKYCRIIRKPIGTRYHYYLQLILEGTPPKKHDFLPEGRVGIDQGISTEAIVSEKGCILTEIAPGRKDIQRVIRNIQRKMDRSRRSTNPYNYNEDGTIVSKLHKFEKSKIYKADRMRLASLRRRNAAFVRQQEEILANRILCEYGSDIITEDMNYKALQAKAKETKISDKTGKYKRKKRFGKSIITHAPARFIRTIERKLGYMDKSVYKVDTSAYKASQYDHVTDTYEKVSLSTRSKTVGGSLVQRDLYSAFLLMCAETPKRPDRTLCKTLFQQFLKNQKTCIMKMQASNAQKLSSFGLKDFAC